MGYRSEVCAVFYCDKEDFPAMQLFFDENTPKDNELFDKTDTDQYEIVDLGDKMMIRYLFVDVKWYDGEGTCQEFMEFMSAFAEVANDEAMSWNYEYVRIGEEYNDIHTLESNDHDHLICIRREIEYNF